ncbi:glycosyltransferase family 2 protein [Ferruginibacter paludis]|uniref:glycosyltransferase family 2 protein n=1 Tax=Ferruginibacter paludis TaxID=1310417 RepID=UPI0025B2F559|nr:glycosyltransferase family 2 protein [Ferruginibacter paludis]MDN3655738.1 glycosyltransferase family 2 protein [Ferruginibacter paludis]
MTENNYAATHLCNQQEQAVDSAEALPVVAIVILNWNGKHFLEQFLPSVIASSYQNKKIIVADNASTDDSITFLQQHFPQVEIIENNTNEGFAKGYNTALQQVTADYYVLLNSDVEVTPGWIEPIIELMENNAGIGACQPKMLTDAARHLFEYAGACGGWLDNFGYPFARGRVFDVVEEDKGQYNEAQPCFWASGAAMFVRADMYHVLGGLDEYFFAHQEEIDFCWRLQLAGYKVYVQPASVVYHVGGGTLAKGNPRKDFLNFRNNLVMLAKNLPVATALWKIPFRMGLDVIAAYQALFSGNGRSFLAIAKAHCYFIKWLLFSKKQSVFPISKSGQLHGWYSGCVVWQYFVKHKKTFSEIIYNK